MSRLKDISSEQMVQAVAEHEVFSKLNETSLKKLEKIVDYQLIQKDKQVFEVGDQPNLIFYLLSGSLTLQFPNTKLLCKSP